MQKLPEEPRSIPEEQFQSTFQKWEKRWEKCVDLQEEDFEGIKLNLEYLLFCVLYTKKSDTF